MRDDLSAKLRRGLPWWAALAGLILVVATAALQLIKKDGAADGTTLGLVGLIVVLLFAVLAAPQAGHFLTRISNFKFAGVELGLKEIKRAERVKPVPGEDDGVEIERTPTVDVKAGGNGQQPRRRGLSSSPSTTGEAQ